GCAVVQQRRRSAQALDGLGSVQEDQCFANDTSIPFGSAHASPCQQQQQLSGLLCQLKSCFRIEPLPVGLLLPVRALQDAVEAQCPFAKLETFLKMIFEIGGCIHQAEDALTAFQVSTLAIQRVGNRQFLLRRGQVLTNTDERYAEEDEEEHTSSSYRSRRGQT